MAGLVESVSTDVVTDVAMRTVAGATKLTLGVAQKFRQTERIWPLNGEGLEIVAAQSEPVKTGHSTRPTTGMGQLLALAYLAPTLSRVWPAFDIAASVRLSAPDEKGLNEQDKQIRESNFVLVGGPKTNLLAERYLEELKLLQGEAWPLDWNIERQRKEEDPDRSILKWRHSHHQSDGFTRLGSREVIQPKWISDLPLAAAMGKPEGKAASLRGDWGLVIRFGKVREGASRPLNLILAGLGTYGTAAAARWYVRNSWRPSALGKDDNKAIRNKNYIALLYVKHAEGKGMEIEVADSYLF